MSSETPGYFQFYFHHTQISFSKIVGEGDIEIIHEGQHFIYLLVQTIKQVFIRWLPNFSTLTRTSFFGRRLYCIALPNNKQIPFSESLQNINLSFGSIDNAGIGKVVSTRTFAAPSVNNRMIRIFDLPHRIAGMPLLPTGFFAAFLP